MQRSTRLAFIRAITLLLLIIVVGSGFYIKQLLTLAAAYNAKILCSNTFISGRTSEQILNQDLTGLERLLFTKTNFQKKAVTSWLPGIPKQKTVFTENFGCVLLAGAKFTDLPIASGHMQQTPLANLPTDVVLDAPSVTNSGFNLQQLQAAINTHFKKTNSDGLKQTRALLVMHEGKLIFERYAAGFTKNMPLLGWSMTKSVINALTGILIKQGMLRLEQSGLIPAWSNPKDPRSKITLSQLLRMSSGLEFDESSGPVLSDVTKMLLLNQNTARYAANKPLQQAPNTVWNYSSGTTNIICKIIKQVTGGTTAGVVEFARTELFKPLGMKHAVIEIDASGNLIGSSFMYATAREWLQFGQLYLQNGIWNKQQILPSGWVQFSSSPTPTAPNGEYAAHFWTNGGVKSKINMRPFPDLPGDLFYASGYKGQRLIILPSQDTVILRLGWHDNFSDKKMSELIKNILANYTPTD